MDGQSRAYEPHRAFRRTPGPEVGHGESLRMTVNRMDAAGMLEGQGRSAMQRFEGRFGQFFGRRG